jgi:hypothetical protein
MIWKYGNMKFSTLKHKNIVKIKFFNIINKVSSKFSIIN